LVDLGEHVGWHSPCTLYGLDCDILDGDLHNHTSHIAASLAACEVDIVSNGQASFALLSKPCTGELDSIDDRSQFVVGESTFENRGVDLHDVHGLLLSVYVLIITPNGSLVNQKKP
jgi:hypothetical protein